jgi:hypothetical protein
VYLNPQVRDQTHMPKALLISFSADVPSFLTIFPITGSNHRHFSEQIG